MPNAGALEPGALDANPTIDSAHPSGRGFGNRPRLCGNTRIWMVVLRSYLVVSGGLVLVRIVTLAAGAG